MYARTSFVGLSNSAILSHLSNQNIWEKANAHQTAQVRAYQLF